MTPIRIIVDCTGLYADPLLTGIQRVTREILRHLPRDDVELSAARFDPDRGLVAIDPPSLALLLEEPARDDPALRQALHHHAANATALEVAADDLVVLPEVFFDPARARFHYQRLRRNPRAVALLSYDFIPWLTPDLFPLPTVVSLMPYLRLVRDAQHVAFISEQTRREHADRILRRPSHRAGPVLPLGADGLGMERQSWSPGRREFVALGSIDGRKNQHRIVAAFEQLWARGSEARLTLLGRVFEDADRAWLDRALGDERFRWIDRPGQEAVAGVLRGARATIYVSAAEGFGLPPVESLAVGIPVIAAANIPSVQELPARGLVRLDEAEPAAIAEAVAGLLDDGRAEALWLEAASVHLPTWRDFGVAMAGWLVGILRPSPDVSGHQHRRVASPERGRYIQMMPAAAGTLGASFGLRPATSEAGPPSPGWELMAIGTQPTIDQRQVDGNGAGSRVSGDRLGILLANNFYPPHVVGGAEIVVARHAEALARRGHRVVAVGGSVPAPGRPPGSLEPEGRPKGVTLERLALRSLDPDDSFRWPSLARRISALLAMHDIDVVHLHNLVGIGVDAILAAKAAGKPCVVTLHDHWGFCLRQSLLRRDGSLCGDTEECAVCQRAIIHEGESLPVRFRRDFVAWCLEQADLVLSPSAYLADAYLRAGVRPARLETLSNGIDSLSIPAAARPGDGVVRFLCSARLEAHKGIAVLLQAVEHLEAEADLAGRWELVLAGDGSLRKKAEALARSLAKGDRPGPLSVTGHLARGTLMERLRAADAVILPSIWPENEPVSLLEGIAVGAALVVTGIGGSAELVQADQTGLVVPPGDAAALAAAMRRLVTEPELTARLGAANRARSGAFNESLTVDRLELLYRQIGAARPEPADDARAVVLIGPGTVPEPLIELVAQLHRHLANPQPRLLRADWAGDAGAAQASLLWLVGPVGAQAAALAALRRDVPVLAPADAGLDMWVAAGAPLLTYRTPIEALAGLQVLLERTAIRARLVERCSVAAAAVALAPQSAFALVAPRL